MTASAYLNQLNQDYLAIHRRKEDYFWQTYMGISDDQAGATKAQTEWTHFLSQGSRIEEIRQQIAAAENISDNEQREQTLQGLNGWLAMFQAHAIESRQAQQLKNELIEFEADLFRKKQQHVLTYTNEHGEAMESK